MSTTTAIRLIDGEIVLDHPVYDRDWVQKARGLPERRYKKEHKGLSNVWIIPTRAAQEALDMFPDSDVDPEILEMAQKQQALANISDNVDANFDVALHTGELLPYQRAGVQFLEMAEGRAIIADEMGLGKTVQAIAYLLNNPELRPVIIVVPASLKINWQREIKRFADYDAHIISGRNPRLRGGENLPDASIYIINYDILTYWLDKLLSLNAQILIADEAHYAKNKKSKRTKAVQKLAQKTERVILLTGTPVTNRPMELWPLLNMVDKAAWPKFLPFGLRYCDGHNNGWGWDFTGSSNLQELHEEIKPYVVRRRKADVLTELPEKRRVTLPLELSAKAMKAYRFVLQEAIDAIDEARRNNEAVGAEHLALIEKAKQAAVSGKMKQAIEWITDFLDTGEKLIVFCTHKFVVQELMTAFPDAVKVTGDDSQTARQDAVDRFQNDDNVNLFIGNIKAAGVGLTLTSASNVAFLEFAWTPGDHVQAEDRAHRIGQQNSVTAWYLVAQNTIDEQIVSLIEEKRQVVDTVTDGTAEGMSFGVFRELVKSMTE